MNINIRNATPKDLEEVYKIGLLEEGFVVSDETRFYGKKYLENWLKNQKGSILLVAVAKKRVVGFIFVNIMINKWAMIENLMIIKPFKKHGVGTALLQEAQKRLRKKKINYIAAWVKDKNLIIQSFLGRHGFKKGHLFVWMEKADKPLWPEHKKDIIKFTEKKNLVISRK